MNNFLAYLSFAFSLLSWIAVFMFLNAAKLPGLAGGASAGIFAIVVYVGFALVLLFLALPSRKEGKLNAFARNGLKLNFFVIGAGLMVVTFRAYFL